MEPAYRIMVVEDSGTQALKLRLILEEEGWSVDTAASAEAALEVLNRSLPDLVVVDYHLPGMQGDELCRRLRMNIDTRNIAVLMLTAEETHAAELRGLESGADDYVPKSVDPEVLLLRIHALLRKSHAQAAILDSGGAYFQRARLLLVDDSPTYLEYLASELEAEGYTVEKVTGGVEALRRIAGNRIDCVLVDLVMPQMDGIEVCRQLTELRRTMDHPIVVLMLTAREAKEDMTRGLEAGADDFVGKSSDLAVLKARIRALLRRKFFQEENQRILQELKEREVETVRARAEQAAAEVRAAMAEQLEQTNQELEAANRKLKEAQSYLVQSEKMASLGQLVAGIAHEINNPLAFILNNIFTIANSLKQIAREVAPQLTGASLKKLEKAQVRLGEMKEGLERVKELVLKLRTFSRLDEGEFKTVDVHEGLEAVLLFLRHRLKGRIQVERNYCADGTLSCYAGQLNQVFMNIIANAVEAIEGQGRIAITTCREGESFAISVRDTGRGVPEAIHQRIFEPFFTTKPVGQGTGLGLAISYSIVQNHQGTIEIHNREEGGTEFLVKIPLGLKEEARS
ncbi:MAG: response regulator [Candidatus Latescibacteria bacterium]|nr:response regulator [Candidatus Latescibacterota bacterium]